MPVTPLAATPARDCPGLVRQGRITEALEALTAQPDPGVADLALLLECRLARGEMELALQLGDRLHRLADLTGEDAARAQWALAELDAATGHDESAVDRYRAVGELHDDPVALPWRAAVAPCLLRSGEARAGQRLAVEQLALARDSGAAYAVAGALRTVAAVCAVVDREGTLRDALILATGRHERLAAQVATDLAGLLALRSGDAPAEAIALLREAESYADLEDLWPLHARVRRLLERLGETPTTPRAEAIARLTASELRVARMAAAGTTNRAIADETGVTVKAVEWHLSHAYRKLGVPGRRELATLFRLA